MRVFRFCSCLGRSCRTDCAVCSDGYTERLGSVCSKCLSHASGIVLAAFFLVGIILAAILVALYVMSGKRTGTRQRLVDRWARLIPLQSLKVIIVSWQILTQVRSIPWGTGRMAAGFQVPPERLFVHVPS